MLLNCCVSWLLLVMVRKEVAAEFGSTTETPFPSFYETPTNISVQESQNAFLPCRVKHLGDRSVTWMRKSNLHIITAGQLTYAPDSRYRVLHPPDADEWTLHIKTAEGNDTGWYECQVNSDPKITRQVRLVVQDKNLKDPFYVHKDDRPNNETTVIAEGPLERYMQAGSILSITCSVIHKGKKAPKYVWWYQGAKRLAYNSTRGGISLQTEKSYHLTTSSLKMSGVQAEDSGRYTCRPSTGGLAAVLVHVQDGQHQAAVHLNCSPRSSLLTPLETMLMISVILNSVVRLQIP